MINWITSKFRIPVQITTHRQSKQRNSRMGGNICNMKPKRDRTSLISFIKGEGTLKTFSEKKGEEFAIPKLSGKELFKDIVVICDIGVPNQSGIPVFTSLNCPLLVNMNWPCD